MSRILFVFTSASKDQLGQPTGWFLPEAAHPYYTLSPHFPIDFAAPAGPNPPMAPTSVEFAKGDDESERFLNDPAVKSLFEHAKPLNAVHSDDYAAIFYVGGLGPVVDLPTDESNIQLVNKIYRSGKVVAAICNGPGALVGVTGADGKSIFDGKVATGFSNAEEEQINKAKNIPFLIEDRIQSLGGTYEKAPNPWEAKVVHSGNLITGQNPASARLIGEEILKTLLAHIILCT